MKYQKYRIPPDFNLAQIHARSCKLYKRQENQNGQTKCGCCNQFVGQDRVSIFQNISTLRKIGEEVPLFFNFVFLMIFLIIFVLFIKAGEYLFLCDQTCDSQRVEYHFNGIQGLNFTIMLGYINKGNNMSMMIELLLYSIIILAIKIHLKRKKYRYRAFNFSIEKRSVQLLNLPKDCTEKQIRNLFKEYHIDDVVFTFRVRQYHKCMIKIAKLKKTLRYFSAKMMQNQQESNKINEIQSKLESTMKQLQEIVKNLNDKKKRLSIAFIVFETVNQRNQVLKKYSCNFFEKLFKKLCTCCSNIRIGKQHISVEPASAPDDIKWQNLQNPYLRTKAIRFSSFLICTTILVFGLVSQVIILNLQSDSKGISGQINQILSSFVIFLLNFFIINFLQFATNQTEAHISNTNIKRSLIRKITFFMFFNVSISPFLIMFYNKVTTQQKQMDLFSRITLTILIVSFGNFFKPLLTLLSITRFKKWISCIKQKSKSRNSLLNQLQANQLFQPLDFPIQIYYSLLHASLMMSFFYLGCFQILILVQLPSLLMLYIIAKWMLLKVCKQPRGLSTKLSNLAQSLMRFYVPLYWLGRNTIHLIIYSHEKINLIQLMKDMIYEDTFQIVSTILVIFMLINEKFVTFIAKRLVQNKKYDQSQYQELVDHNRTYRQANLFFKIHEQDFTRITVRLPKNNKESKEQSEQVIELNSKNVY